MRFASATERTSARDQPYRDEYQCAAEHGSTLYFAFSSNAQLMKRKKPAQDHTGIATRVERVECEIIGYVHSPYKERFGTPRQPPVTEQTLDDRAQEATIELVAGRNFEQALKDLEGFEYIWVLAWLHLNEGWNPQVIPPRGPKVKRGLFATRAPHRPRCAGGHASRRRWRPPAGPRRHARIGGCCRSVG